jgi:hypothetical protein
MGFFPQITWHELFFNRWPKTNLEVATMYIYTNSKLLREQPNANPIICYEKNMLF